MTCACMGPQNGEPLCPCRMALARQHINRRSIMSHETNECDHCGMKPLPCPFCGKPGKIFGDNMVGCSDTNGCMAAVDFGHWTGEDDDGVPAVHYVIEQWNKRVQ